MTPADGRTWRQDLLLLLVMVLSIVLGVVL
jgi:hypothetical protein